MKKRNQFNLSLQKIKNLEALAENKDLIISPTSDNKQNIINVADSILHGGKSSTIASVAAEMEMMRRVALSTSDKENVKQDKENVKQTWRR